MPLKGILYRKMKEAEREERAFIRKIKKSAHKLSEIKGDLRNELEEDGEISLHLTRAFYCHCNICGYEWESRKGGIAPAICPKCRSGLWSHYRVFKCKQCGHEFETKDIETDPKGLFPTCPNCGLADWRKKKSGCFIATLAYGTSLDKRIDYLRDFRDESLAKYFIGRKIIKFYYRFSPDIVIYLKNKNTSKIFIRFLIGLLIKTLKLFHKR